MVSGTLSLQPMGKTVLVLMIQLGVGIMGFFTQGFAKRTWQVATWSPHKLEVYSRPTGEPVAFLFMRLNMFKS
jgi:hypothetical protein